MGRKLLLILMGLFVTACGFGGRAEEAQPTILQVYRDPLSGIAPWLDEAASQFSDGRVTIATTERNYMELFPQLGARSTLMIAEVASFEEMEELPGFYRSAPWRTLHSSQMVLAAPHDEVVTSLRTLVSGLTRGDYTIVQPTPESVLGLHALALQAVALGIDPSEDSATEPLEKMIRTVHGRSSWMLPNEVSESPVEQQSDKHRVFLLSNSLCGLLKQRGLLRSFAYPQEGTVQIWTVAYVPEWAEQPWRSHAERFLEFLDSERGTKLRSKHGLDVKCLDEDPELTVHTGGMRALISVHQAWRRIIQGVQ